MRKYYILYFVFYPIFFLGLGTGYRSYWILISILDIDIYLIHIRNLILSICIRIWYIKCLDNKDYECRVLILLG
jgi:hypothetical protein